VTGCRVPAGAGRARRDATVEKVTDYGELARLGVMSTPALAVDGKLTLSGSVPDVAHLKHLLTAS
jgi:protein-disulfide isomerase